MAREEPIYFYVCCENCRKRLFIGADFDNAPTIARHMIDATVEEGVSPVVRDVLYDVVAALEGVVKFVQLHGSHQVFIWNTADLSDAPRSYDDEWTYDVDEHKHKAPSWWEINPLGTLNLIKHYKEVLEQLSRQNEILTVQNCDLRIALAEDQQSRNKIRAELSEYARKTGAVVSRPKEKGE